MTNTVETTTPLGTTFHSQRSHWASAQAISFLMQQAVENRGVLSLAAGLVDQATLPVAEVRAAAEQLLADDARARDALQYGTTAGAERLRRLLVAHLARLEGTTPHDLGLSAEQLIVTTGSQQFLSLVCETLFDPGDICLVGAPTYFVFLGNLQGVGARAVPIHSDAEGMSPEALDRQLAELDAAGELERVRLIYVVSYYDNPSGISVAAERRRAFVEIARRWSKHRRIFVLEDAAYRELRYDGPVLPSVWGQDEQRDTVLLTQTFSKSFAPGLRVGFGVVPQELVKPICDRKGNEDFGSANFNQHLLACALESGRYADHVSALRDSYRAKRDAMLRAADLHFGDVPGVQWVHPHGGLYVWMSLPEHIETGFESPLFQAASRDEKVMYVPGELFFGGPEPLRERNHMRLSFGVQDADGIVEGIRRLAAAVRRVV